MKKQFQFPFFKAMLLLLMTAFFLPSTLEAQRREQGGQRERPAASRSSSRPQDRSSGTSQKNRSQLNQRSDKSKQPTDASRGNKTNVNTGNKTNVSGG
ncbi:MAG TPA: hypothetical protein PKN12_05215, partial [Bacteroidales bacterium]|nr:hypothetical protein [Bacteroidales bacterium]HPT09486.1 hypothetical protein [Bacteroidales bacterium]